MKREMEFKMNGYPNIFNKRALGVACPCIHATTSLSILFISFSFRLHAFTQVCPSNVAIITNPIMSLNSCKFTTRYMHIGSILATSDCFFGKQKVQISVPDKQKTRTLSSFFFPLPLVFVDNYQ